MAISLIATASTDASTGTAVSLTHGFTLASGDVVIVLVNANGTGNTCVDNNGAKSFTSVTSGASPDSNAAYIFSRICDGGEGSAFAFTLGSSNRWSIIARQYRGVHSDVWDVAPGAANFQSGNFSGTTQANAITILTAGACALILMADDYAPTTTTYTSVDNNYGNAKSESGQQYAATVDKLGLETGTTGATTITSSAYTSVAMWHCALKAALEVGQPMQARNVWVPGVRKWQPGYCPGF